MKKLTVDEAKDFTKLPVSKLRTILANFGVYREEGHIFVAEEYSGPIVYPESEVLYCYTRRSGSVVSKRMSLANAAEELGIQVTTLSRAMRRYGSFFREGERVFLWEP